MSDPVQEPEQPAEEPEAPVETDEPGPSDDEAVENEDDELELEPEPEGEPEPEQPVDVQPESPDDRKRHRAAAIAVTTYAKKIAQLFPESADELLGCPLCGETQWPGFVHIGDAGKAPEQVKQATLAFLGFATEIEYKQGSRFSVCPECDGETKVKTGSKDPRYAAITCPKCKGTGFLDSGAAPSNGNVEGELVMTGPMYVDDPGEPADTDPSGEPRLLPDGRENPNFGKWPQFKIPVPPWGTTAGLTVQDAVAS